jgi:hypothetical protein
MICVHLRKRSESALIRVLKDFNADGRGFPQMIADSEPDRVNPTVRQGLVAAIFREFSFVWRA